MIKFKIREPIWKNQSVGLDEEKIVDDVNVEILYKNKDGDRVYPHKYTMPKDIALRFPTMKVKGKNLRIIPIGAFKIN